MADKKLRPPAFRFYVDNFVEGTADFTDAEVGLYMRLLCAQWSRGSLPNNDSDLLRFSRGLTGDKPDLSRIKEKFEVGQDGRLRNARMERERQKQLNFSKSQSDKGKAKKTPPKEDQPGINPGSTGVQPSVSGSGSTIKTPAQAPVDGKKKKKEPSKVLKLPVVPPGAPSKEELQKRYHQDFIAGWCQNFETHLGCKYQVQGGRDGAAVKELLTFGMTVFDLLSLARRAWQVNPPTYETKQARTICGFKNTFNQIQVLLKNETTPTNRRNLNAGTGVDLKARGERTAKLVADQQAKRAGTFTPPGPVPVAAEISQSGNVPSEVAGNGGPDGSVVPPVADQ